MPRTHGVVYSLLDHDGEPTWVVIAVAREVMVGR